MNTHRYAFFAALLVVSAFQPASAAPDANGYTAQYECRAGNPNCDVDMTPPPCDVTVYPGDDWSEAIANNPGARSFCMQCGDHRVFGDNNRDQVVLDPSVSGTASARRWLRYSCPGDNGAHPVQQQPDQRAYAPRFLFMGADYWILDRLTIDFDGRDINTAIRFEPDLGSENNIMNRLLLEDATAHFVQLNYGNANNTLQNSVVRNPVQTVQFESQCVSVGAGPNFHVVNNEIYNCQKAVSNGNGIVDHPGLVIENNDLYATPDVYTDCQGNFTPDGQCGLTEGMISLKAGGTQSQPAQVIHNRLWGSRTGDPRVSQELAGDGDAMTVGISGDPEDPRTQGYPGGDWVLFRNNVIWDSGIGLGSAFPSAENLSIVGNLFWDMANSARDPNSPSTFNTYGGINNSEFYFNTIVAGDGWLKAYGDTYDDDFRCNLIVGAGQHVGGLSSGTQITNNAFYGTPPLTTESPSSDVVHATVADAQQSQFCFYRKLLTGAEQFCIPDAMPTAGSPHRNACDASIGSRSGIGINNVAGSSWTDLLGRTRDTTPDMGAIEFTTGSPAGQTPYGGTPRPVPGLVEAEHYDEGGEGVAYHDLTAGNVHGAYRNEDVDIVAANAGDYYVADTQAGEWLEYTVDVAVTGAYTLEMRVASASGGGGSIHIEFDGVDKTGSISIPDTGGWQNWTIVTRTVTLNAGQQIMRIMQDTNGGTGYIGNVDYLRFSQTSQQSPYLGVPHAIPGTIQTEDYDLGGEGVAYHDDSSGNRYGAYRSDDVDLYPGNDGPYLAEDKSGEWLEYSVDVATAGTYTVELRVASTGGGGNVHLEFDGVDVTGAITIPDTGAWQNWAIVTRTVTLSAGRQIMRLMQDTNGATGYVGNIDYLRFTPASGPTGTILREHWLGISGDDVTQLTSHPSYPDNPSGSDQLISLEAPTDWADDYGTRIRGYLHPPVTGTYTFWIASDDYSELWLSTNDNPNGKTRIASVNDWTNPREWTKYASQQSSPITLTAGQRYYIEILHKEGTVLDNLAVGWQLPDGTFEGPIPGSRLSPINP